MNEQPTNWACQNAMLFNIINFERIRSIIGNHDSLENLMDGH